MNSRIQKGTKWIWHSSLYIEMKTIIINETMLTACQLRRHHRRRRRHLCFIVELFAVVLMIYSICETDTIDAADASAAYFNCNNRRAKKKKQGKNVENTLVHTAAALFSSSDSTISRKRNINAGQWPAAAANAAAVVVVVAVAAAEPSHTKKKKKCWNDVTTPKQLLNYRLSLREAAKLPLFASRSNNNPNRITWVFSPNNRPNKKERETKRG